MSDANWRLRLYRLVWPDRELPVKTDPMEFGGGKTRGVYTQGEVERRLCSRAGCWRMAHACWSGCADDNVQRPLCAECDIDLNRQVLQWWGDPEWEARITAYANGVQAEVERDLDVPWLERA